jgi:hypothetical protein
MKLFEIKTTTPDAETSISGKGSIWDSYKTTAKDFEEALKKAQKGLDPRLKEKIHSINYVCEVK